MKAPLYILGISAYFHDSAACLIKDGVIVGAAQEERFTRLKHDPSFPHNAIQYCLDSAGISAEDLDQVVFYEKPFLKFERLLETYLEVAPQGFSSFATSMPVWLKEKLFLKRTIIKELETLSKRKPSWADILLFSEHHLSHLASAFYPSPFERAAIITIDGVGEWTTTSAAIGNGNKIEIIKELKFPHSLGLLYSAFTYYCGFKVNSGEYKLMGLAPYGKPVYAELIKEKLVDISDDGSFSVDISYFDFLTGLTMTSRKFHELFGGPPRVSEGELTRKEMDLAASIQSVTEEIVLKIARNVRKETGETNLCLAGGVALNCVANGKLFKENIFERIWVQPAAGDAGAALGAAFVAWHLYHERERRPSNDDMMRGAFLGPEFADKESASELAACGAVFRTYPEDEMIETVSDALVDGKAIGWMQGRMEFGPRALGGRSILADARSPKMQKQLNLKIKYRESFRPFAPSILRESVNEWFELDSDSPYMLVVAPVNPTKRVEIGRDGLLADGFEMLESQRSQVPAVTHVDWSARIQTVHRETNEKYHKLISRFADKTGCPLIVNTSFNVRGEPIICTPKDAFKCFMGTELDVLVIGNHVLLKDDQDIERIEDYREKYELD